MGLSKGFDVDDNDNDNDDEKGSSKSKAKQQGMNDDKARGNGNKQETGNKFARSSADLTLEEILGDDDENVGMDNNENSTNCNDEKDSGMNFNNINLSEKEEKALELFMPKSQHEQLTLTDIIMKRVVKFENDNISDLGTEKMIQRKIPKQIISVYKDVGNVLSKWRSGKLPKAFKIIPILSDWEEILYLTSPDDWTPHATYQATKLFASQAKASICQRYYNLVLLPKVREDIRMNKKLNFHLYQSVRKALFKSQAFMRGFFLPLCMDECRAREALILGGIIAKNSIPIIQSALAIYKILDLEYSGPVHYFLKILLNKRYALPVKVVNKLIQHFSKFENDPRNMPVIWHQTFLVFVQRYHKNLSKEDKLLLKKVLKKQFHKDITPIIRKQLFVAQNAITTSVEIDI